MQERKGSFRLLIGGTAAALLAGCAATGAAAPATLWTCEGRTGTAYEYDQITDRWETRVFPVADQRFAIARSGGDYVLVQEGTGRQWRCAELPADGGLVCGPDEAFRFTRGNLRFVSHLDVRPTTAAAGSPPLPAATVYGRCR